MSGFLKGVGKVAKIAAPIAASFIPGVGPFIAPAIGALTNLPGASKGEKAASAQYDTASNLATQNINQANDFYKNAFGFGTESAQQGANSMATGANTMAGPKQYWQSILSGSRPELAAAMGPEINTITGQADAARQAAATLGTARGGGTSAIQQQIPLQVMGATERMLQAVRPEAAKATQQIGEFETQAGLAQKSQGLQQMEQSLRALGLSGEQITNIMRTSILKQQQEAQLAEQRKSQWRNIAQNLLGLIPGVKAAGGGGGGTSTSGAWTSLMPEADMG